MNVVVDTEQRNERFDDVMTLCRIAEIAAEHLVFDEEVTIRAV